VGSSASRVALEIRRERVQAPTAAPGSSANRARPPLGKASRSHSKTQPRRPPAPPAVFPAAPIAVRGVFSPLRALQARPVPAWPQAHRPVEAPDVTGCRWISCSEHFPGQLAVVRAPPPPSGVGTTAMHHRASPQGAELTARDITFSGLRRRVACMSALCGR
jgi:hypothetical protein